MRPSFYSWVISAILVLCVSRSVAESTDFYAAEINKRFHADPSYQINAEEVDKLFAIYLKPPERTSEKAQTLGVLRKAPYVLRMQIGIENYLKRADSAESFNKIVMTMFSLASPDGVREMKFSGEMLGNIQKYGDPAERAKVTAAWSNWLSERIIKTKNP